MSNSELATPPGENEIAGEADTPPTNRLLQIAMVLPVVAVAILLIVVNSWSIIYRIQLPYTQSPWESMAVADAYRAAHGQPIYEPPGPNGHAPHIYGPLITQVMAVVFRMAGPNLYTARIINCFAALLASAILIRIYVNYRKPLDLLIGIALMLSLHCRSRAYFVESRPDMLAWLFATLALICFYRAHQRNEFGLWYPIGLAWVVLTFLSKQTYACCAAVPLLAILLLQPQPLRKHLIVALLPLACLGLTMIVLKQVRPSVYYYMVTVPKMYGIPPERLKIAWDILMMSMPLYPAAVMGFFYRLRSDPDGDGPAPNAWLAPKMIWLIAAAWIGFAASVTAFGKQFATINSLLISWIPMTVFCCVVTPALVRWLYRSSTIALAAIPRPASIALHLSGACFLAFLILVTAFSAGRDEFNWDQAHGSREYAHLIELCRELNGPIVCPEDPTIPMFATGYVGRNLHAELDAAKNEGMPAGIVAEVDKARWVVHVTAGYRSKISERLLKNWGFRRFRTLGSAYSLWIRNREPERPVAPRKGPTTRRTSP